MLDRCLLNPSKTQTVLSLLQGVMIPHAAIVSASAGVLASVPQADASAVYLAYLPLAHVLELSAEHALLTLGASIG